MATERKIHPTDGSGAGWKERLRGAWEAASSLLSTRAEIFRQELAEKGARLRRSAIGFGVGLLFAWLASLLLTALVATLLANLLGSLWAGLLASVLLYAAIAGAGIWIGVQALSRVRPLEFPATKEEIGKDWSALRRAARDEDQRIEPVGWRGPGGDLEERFRRGSE